jgi:tetratricopeptide (TPR) repeat protein
MTTEEAAKNWSGEPIRLLFIDGNHQYEYVKKDFMLWEPYLIDEGVIVFHDCFTVYTPGVLKCVDENIFRSNKFGDLGIIDTSLYAFKKKRLTLFERMRKENFLKLLTPSQKIIKSAQDVWISLKERKFNKVKGKIKEIEEMIYMDKILPDFVKIQFYFCVCYFLLSQRKYQEAESRYKEILSRGVQGIQKFDAICGLANLYTQQGKYQEAATKYEEALLMEKSSPLRRLNIFRDLGNLYIQQQRYKEAEERLDQALSLADSIGSVLDAANIHYNKGSMYEKMELFGKAKGEFKAIPYKGRYIPKRGSLKGVPTSILDAFIKGKKEES